MQTLIFGAGGVGQGLGSASVLGGADTTFLTRGATAEALREKGLRRSGLFGDVRIASHRYLVLDSLEYARNVEFDYILVCTKSFDSKTAAESLRSAGLLENAVTRVVLCQNGWGNAEVFAGYLPAERIFNGRVITGFHRLVKHHVYISVHADAVKLGSLYGADCSPLQPLATTLSDGGIPTELSPNIARDLWAKMLYNCCLNPLGAILELTYGALSDSPPSRRVMEAIAAETFQVMQISGYETHWPTVEEFLGAFYGQMVANTRSHESSMLQDVAGGRQTEIDALCGAVSALGRAHGLATPASDMMVQLVRAKERIGADRRR